MYENMRILYQEYAAYRGGRAFRHVKYISFTDDIHHFVLLNVIFALIFGKLISVYVV